MTDTWTWATVTQASPLRIKVDGDTTALDATTGDLVGSLAVDDRVRVHLHSDGIIVTGLQGGVVDTTEATAATANTLALRDGSGQLKAADGVAADDVATVGQMSGIQSSDATYPVAATGITAETVVDRITIAAAPYARRVSVSTVVFALVSIQHMRAELVIYSGATDIGRSRHQFYLASANEAIPGVGYVELAAGAGAVIEVRISRNTGSGTVTTSASANLTKTVAHSTPAV